MIHPVARAYARFWTSFETPLLPGKAAYSSEIGPVIPLTGMKYESYSPEYLIIKKLAWDLQ